MTQSERGYTAELAEFVARLTYDDLPPETIHHAKRLILDTLSCAVGGTRLGLGQEIIRHFTSMGGRPEAQVIGELIRLPALHATYVNSYLTNLLDFDDTYENRSHPGGMVVPPAFAVGEAVGASGKELILATVVGYELAIRVGEATMPSPERFRQVWGIAKHQGFGTAALAAKLMKFNGEQTANTLGLAGANAVLPFSRKSGLTLSERPRAQVKNNFGWASMGGVLAAQLTQLGMIGNRTFLDGPKGFWVMSGSDRFDPNVLVEGLGKDYHLGKIALKPYASCRWTHTALEAAGALREAHSLTPSDLAGVRIHTFREVAIDFNMAEPPTIIDAQFALPYAVALELHGKSPSGGMDEADIHDPEILATARLVELVEDADMTRTFEHDGSMPVVVEVQTRDGGVYRRSVSIPKGAPSRPLSKEEIERKASLLIDPVAGRSKAAAFIDRVWNLEHYLAGDLLPCLFDPRPGDS